MRGHLQAMLDRMSMAKPQGERVMLSNDQGEHATLAPTWFGKENKTWLLTEYDQKPPAPGNILFGSGNPVAGAGEPNSPPADSSTTCVEQGQKESNSAHSPGGPSAPAVDQARVRTFPISVKQVYYHSPRGVLTRRL